MYLGYLKWEDLMIQLKGQYHIETNSSKIFKIKFVRRLYVNSYFLILP